MSISKKNVRNESPMNDKCLLQSATGFKVDLYDHFQSATGFLICSGPSLRGFDLSPLQSRGILTCTVNNAGTLFRSNLWVAHDNPGNFSDVIWRDPGMLKFIPIHHLDQGIRVRDSNGELVDSNETARQMPATLGYKSNSIFSADRWLTEDSINCGDADDNINRKGQPSARSVMLVALRLLHHLGVRRVFLLGCDFRMSFGSENYAFDQSRSRRSIRMNNNTYRILCDKFNMLLPHFKSAGFEVFNCTPNSCLTVFPFVDFEEAVKLSTKNMPSRIETKGMYENPR